MGGLSASPRRPRRKKEEVTKALGALLGLLTLGASNGPRADTPVFACSLGKKQVSVRSAGRSLIYLFGSAKKTELTIVGSVANRNLFYRTDRYASIQNQLRFTNGRYSYVVHSVGPNKSVGASGDSGLVVMDGLKRISDLSCRRWTELSLGAFASWGLPEDDEQYSAM